MVNLADILNASILIVDDQDANVTLLERMLRDVGYICIVPMLRVGTLAVPLCGTGRGASPDAFPRRPWEREENCVIPAKAHTR